MKKLKHKRFPGQFSVVNQRINERRIKTSLLRSESNCSSCESEFPDLVCIIRNRRSPFGVDCFMDVGAESQRFSSCDHSFTSSCGAHLCLAGNCTQWEVTHHLLSVREEISFLQYVSFQMTLGVSY